METDVQQRTCGQCGAQNGPAADFCWQCYARFSAPQTGYAAAGPASGTVAAGLARRAAGAPTASPVALGGGSPTALVVKGTILVALALGGWLAWGHFFGGIGLPGQVGGQPRMESGMIERMEEMAQEAADRVGIEVAIGAYGSAATPAYLLVVSEVPEGQDMDAFSAGFVAASGTSSEALEPATAGGVEFLCGPGNPAGAQCIWIHEGIGGAFAGYDSTVEELLALAPEVLDQVEG